MLLFLTTIGNKFVKNNARYRDAAMASLTPAVLGTHLVRSVDTLVVKHLPATAGVTDLRPMFERSRRGRCGLAAHCAKSTAHVTIDQASPGPFGSANCNPFVDGHTLKKAFWRHRKACTAVRALEPCA